MLRGILISIVTQLVLATNAAGAPTSDKSARAPSQPAAKVSATSGAKASAASTVPFIPKRAGTKKMLVQKVRLKAGQTAVNMNEVQINGEAVRPVVSDVGSGKSDVSFDLIPVRKSWHSEMIHSSTEY